MKFVVDYLTGLESFKIERYYSAEKLLLLDNRKFSCAILYANLRIINDNWYKKLETFVLLGGSFLAFHSTTNSFRNQASTLKL